MLTGRQQGENNGTVFFWGGDWQLVWNNGEKGRSKG